MAPALLPGLWDAGQCPQLQSPEANVQGGLQASRLGPFIWENGVFQGDGVIHLRLHSSSGPSQGENSLLPTRSALPVKSTR